MFCRLATITMLLVGLSGFAGQQATSSTLYQRLGGEAGIHDIVTHFLINVADDPRIVGYFAHTNIDHLADSLEQYLCELSDGPCTYEGPSMARAHQHMGLTDASFNALVDNLQRALMDQKIDVGARNALLGRLAPQYSDVMRDQ
ncbi:group I truncated hemoglobin [Kushneria pakistanensis]|nr:group 1 truncated hemoglobin [Kushneria pakistanensis]